MNPGPPASGPETLIAGAPAARAALRLLDDAAPGARALLIRGEAGTGRSRWAARFHERAGGGPLETADCSLLGTDLFEATLFGVAPGAATGVEPRPGLVARAAGGTLVFDRLELLDAGLQAKLLRLLDDGEYAPLGGAPRRAACRFVAILTDEPGAASVSGVPAGLRPDLFYRLGALTVALPPLRERREDLPAFAAALTGKPARLTPAALAALAAQPWPGNLRELSAVLEGAVRRARGARVDVRHLPAPYAAPWPAREAASAAPAPAAPETLDAVERRHVLATLAACGGNRTRAAAALGISRKSLWERLRRWGAAHGGAD